MRYKRMGRNGAYRVNIPTLSGGVNVSAAPTVIADNELASAQNVLWRDGVLQKRQAVRAVGTAPFAELAVTAGMNLTSAANSISAHPIDVDGELCTIVHSGVRYGISTAAEQVQVISLSGAVKATYAVVDYHVQDAAFAPCDKEKYGCSFLMYRGNRVWKPDDDTGRMVCIPDAELYAPLVMVNGKSVPVDNDTDQRRLVDGVMYEGFNLLTRRYRVRFTTQGGNVAERFYMPTALVIGSEVTLECITPTGTAEGTVQVGATGTLTHDGQTYTLSAKADGMIAVKPAFPEGLVADNLTVTASAATSASDSTLGATLAAWFGGTQNKLGGTRLFLAGFSNDKAKVMWSDVGNPLYFSENNYMYVGDPSQRVTALEKQGDMLVIFKERELFYTTYVQGEIDADSVANGTNVDVTVCGAYFPLTQLSPYIGCDAPHSIATCLDRLVWVCSDGRVYTLAEGSQYSERNVREIGQKIHPLMRAHDKASLTRASAMDYNGQYVVLIGNTAYSFDYGDNGFAAVTSYNTAEKASKAIAWYVHRLEAFGAYEFLRLVSDGKYKAILISTQARVDSFTHIRMLYRFVKEACDSHAAITVSDSGALTTVITDAPITARLTTKSFDFGDIGGFKRIGALFLAADGEELVLRFSADGKELHAPCRVHADGHGGRLVLPGVKRCRTFAVTVESEAAFTLLGMRLQYTPFGTVR